MAIDVITDEHVPMLITAGLLRSPEVCPGLPAQDIDPAAFKYGTWRSLVLTQVKSDLCGMPLAGTFNPRDVGSNPNMLAKIITDERGHQPPEPTPTERDLVHRALAAALTSSLPTLPNHLRLKLEAALDPSAGNAPRAVLTLAASQAYDARYAELRNLSFAADIRAAEPSALVFHHSAGNWPKMSDITCRDLHGSRGFRKSSVQEQPASSRGSVATLAFSLAEDIDRFFCPRTGNDAPTLVYFLRRGFIAAEDCVMIAGYSNSHMAEVLQRAITLHPAAGASRHEALLFAADCEVFLSAQLRALGYTNIQIDIRCEEATQ